MFFGDAELDRVIAALEPDTDAAQAVLEAHRRWIGAGTPPADDVTLVVVEAGEMVARLTGPIIAA